MLTSVEAIIDEIGGNAEAARLSGVGASAISMWKARKRIPADKSLVFREALERVGKEADPSLFGLLQVEVERR